jgi:hypothetical protein
VNMHPVLHTAFLTCATQLEAVDTNAAQLHPEGCPNVPSMQQSVERVLCSIRSSCELLERRLKKGRLPRAIKRTKLEWALQVMILGFGFVPANMPLTEYYEPRKGSTTPLTGRELARQLGAEIESLDALLTRCRAEFGMERVEHHPLLGPMRVDQWRRCQVLQLRLLSESITAMRKSLVEPVTQSAQQTASVA